MFLNVVGGILQEGYDEVVYDEEEEIFYDRGVEGLDWECCYDILEEKAEYQDGETHVVASESVDFLCPVSFL